MSADTLTAPDMLATVSSHLISGTPEWTLLPLGDGLWRVTSGADETSWQHCKSGHMHVPPAAPSAPDALLNATRVCLYCGRRIMRRPARALSLLRLCIRHRQTVQWWTAAQITTGLSVQVTTVDTDTRWRATPPSLSPSGIPGWRIVSARTSVDTVDGLRPDTLWGVRTTIASHPVDTVADEALRSVRTTIASHHPVDTVADEALTEWGVLP